MSNTRRIATPAIALSFATLGLVATPANAAPGHCQGRPVSIQGSNADETYDIYTNRVVINHPQKPSNDPTIISLLTLQRRLVISTGKGNDAVVVHGTMDVTVCFEHGPHDGTDSFLKSDGDSNVAFAGDGTFWSTGGDNNVRIGGSGNATMGPGTDIIRIEGDGWADGGLGNDKIFIEGNGSLIGSGGDDELRIEGDGTIFGGTGDDDIFIGGTGTAVGGDGNDEIHVDGRATIDAGPGNDIISTGSSSDHIITGPGIDVVNAGGYEDWCDWTYETRPDPGDTYTNCEHIYGQQIAKQVPLPRAHPLGTPVNS